MKINKNIELIDLAVLVDKTLIISDVHIGFEEYLNAKGILVPRFHFKDTIKKLDELFDKLKKRKIKIERIIVNGDLKHEFGTISRQEWKETLEILDYFSSKAKEIVLIKGNHDNILGPIAKKKNLQIMDSYSIGGILIIHGNKKIKIPKEIKTLIIGHEHPAITIRDKTKYEKYKCFLLGKYERKTLLVMPSFNTLLEGTDILKEKLLSPFLHDISKFKAYVVADKIYDFGIVKNLEKRFSFSNKKSLR